ncbi:MAG: calcium-translocating P-type ATPase, PMCA-type [Syntrophomonadaceae bacterium]|nr:calcium-translocating P-type ATPase, PMCA-type [Syntrophomonadaceae bacterium]
MHHDTLEHIVKELQADPVNGFSDDKARELLGQYGENKLHEKKKKTSLQRFAGQFKDVMILILIAASVISFTVAIYEGHGFFEPILILLIVVLNAVMGVIQESKAEKALDALKDLSAPHARTVRDGELTIIEASQLVPGDIILLSAGDFVPADARIITSASLKSDESALTGESVPAEKDAEAKVAQDTSLGDRHNMLYSGCSITNGRARAVVTSTGMDTEMGKIANLLAEEADTQTPLQQKLASLGKYLGMAALAACGVIFIIGLSDGMPVMEIFMTAVSLAVSAIPEGLPAIVTVVLAIGVQRMVKRNAIIRRLPAVETLGSASVICSDKTGTLTQNRMTLTHLFDAEADVLHDLRNDVILPSDRLLRYAALCCDGRVVFEDGQEKHIGDPTETAIILAAHKNGIDKDELDAAYPRLSELPFDSKRKLMTTVNRIDGRNVVIVKGAFDVLVRKCVAGNIAEGQKYADELGALALRVLAVAYKEVEELPLQPTPENLEAELTFMGLVGLIDPPRPEAQAAVALCRVAGIKPVMITGDHVLTASAIAKELGILADGDDCVSGSEFALMSEEELNRRVRTISVYARVSPSDKIRIVRAWQRQGDIVAMTGDGVNDAPALKAADIGCAMGITGTDVAKGAADMTLTDDNFATIVEAVREGRGIYDNIKKVIGYLLGTNIGEILIVFFAMLFWRESPLLPMQLLWINLVTDSLPAIALGMEPVEEDVMRRPPKSKNEGIFANGYSMQIVLQGLMFAVLTLIGFRIGWQYTGDITTGRTMAFFILALTQVIHSFNMRSTHSLFQIGAFTNSKLNGAAAISTAMVALVVFVPPVAAIFGLTQLSAGMYGGALLLAFIPVLVLELSKRFGLIK